MQVLDFQVLYLKCGNPQMQCNYGSGITCQPEVVKCHLYHTVNEHEPATFRFLCNTTPLSFSPEISGAHVHL